MAYHTIDEESNSVGGADNEFSPTPLSSRLSPDSNGSTTTVNQNTQINDSDTITASTTSRIVNLILFFMFSIAFIVDYLAMRSYIYK